MYFFLLLLYMCLSDFCLLLGHPLLKKEPCVAVKLLLSAVGTREGQLVPSCFVTIFLFSFHVLWFLFVHLKRKTLHRWILDLEQHDKDFFFYLLCWVVLGFNYFPFMYCVYCLYTVKKRPCISSKPFYFSIFCYRLSSRSSNISFLSIVLLLFLYSDLFPICSVAPLPLLWSFFPVVGLLLF